MGPTPGRTFGAKIGRVMTENCDELNAASAVLRPRKKALPSMAQVPQSSWVLLVVYAIAMVYGGTALLAGEAMLLLTGLGLSLERFYA